MQLICNHQVVGSTPITSSIMNENRIYYVCCYVKGREDVEIGQRKGAYTLDEAKDEILRQKRGRHRRRLDYRIYDSVSNIFLNNVN